MRLQTKEAHRPDVVTRIIRNQIIETQRVCTLQRKRIHEAKNIKKQREKTGLRVCTYKRIMLLVGIKNFDYFRVFGGVFFAGTAELLNLLLCTTCKHFTTRQRKIVCFFCGLENRARRARDTDVCLSKPMWFYLFSNIITLTMYTHTALCVYTQNGVSTKRSKPMHTYTFVNFLCGAFPQQPCCEPWHAMCEHNKIICINIIRVVDQTKTWASTSTRKHNGFTTTHRRDSISSTKLKESTSPSKSYFVCVRVR